MFYLIVAWTVMELQRDLIVEFNPSLGHPMGCGGYGTAREGIGLAIVVVMTLKATLIVRAPLACTGSWGVVRGLLIGLTGALRIIRMLIARVPGPQSISISFALRGNEQVFATIPTGVNRAV